MSGIPAPDLVFARAVPLIRQSEGFSQKPYADTAGRATIGYGTTQYPDGRAVALTDVPITTAIGEVLLQSALAKIWKTLAQHLAYPPTVNQAAALLSLAYNIGAGAMLASLLWAKFNAGDRAGAAEEFPYWNKARVNGVLVAMPGLTARRRREQALFLEPASI